MSTNSAILVSICARKGSKGVPLKNTRPLHGVPLIAHTIHQARSWPRSSRVVVSTDSEEIADIARQHGADVPFIRPAELATDTISKMPVLHHALEECEKFYGTTFDTVLDLDPTSPVRTSEDIEHGWEVFHRSGCDCCFSVVKARKNPYFNLVERKPDGQVRPVKELGQSYPSRQSAPEVWDMNASIYFYRRDFLISRPASIWHGSAEFFEMPAESAFDIDEERDFAITELMMKLRGIV